MVAIAFDDADTWRPLVEAALVHPDSYAGRLTHAGIDCAYGDCSGLDDVFARPELSAILASIELGLAGRAVRFFHGCRLEEGGRRAPVIR